MPPGTLPRKYCVEAFLNSSESTLTSSIPSILFGVLPLSANRFFVDCSLEITQEQDDNTNCVAMARELSYWTRKLYSAVS